ncbi:MAG: hypothetical protein K0R18_1691 [Bacillales bacterium]|jgi:cell fate (sporulation/competence/biofilm development) regulator YmcA (YheA/YmcA/DUF963 family)|nr:hypothetical protein [Bacillales bacterium]
MEKLLSNSFCEVNMEQLSLDDIFKKTEELATLIAETEEVTNFKKVEEQLSENQKVNYLIQKIKDLQKQAVNLEHFEKTTALRNTENIMSEMQSELDSMPFIQEYKRSQYEANEMLQMVTSIISDTISDELKK